MKNIWYLDFPIGKIGIAEDDGAISHILFENEQKLEDYELAETALIQKAARQLNEYFAGKRMVFDLPVRLDGTHFQKSVWEALQTIPAGKVRSYKDIAVMIGNPKATRAVGMANNRNPIPIIVPCHRVIGANGSLTGYAGGLAIKQYLLDLEKQPV
ncbi:methylated-DNA--[protein]-cysteine S-methyltransferase [Acetonema longum]|uniref:Methylated-DNA--protein-cysteine methyltransferase n=1 Tax=Acetonema longum DSM 6540 TaxID=1009370 RepID=F7NNA2_9FIRM|nr:methylated-DNA--[protein]-cysteine S-methyltransferase [Acetonema longum]EGO62487.1 methylated-DNA/protein-cysteinemethyltransferase [Acetonema longum DSM 6540]